MIEASLPARVVRLEHQAAVLQSRVIFLIATLLLVALAR